MLEPADIDPVELTLELYDAAEHQDIERVMRFYASSAVWDMSDPGIGTFEGVSAIRGFITDWWATWGDHRREVREIVGLSGGVVFAALREVGRLAQSDARVEQLRGLCFCGRMD